LSFTSHHLCSHCSQRFSLLPRSWAESIICRIPQPTKP
jgi:hypothetical protein